MVKESEDRPILFEYFKTTTDVLLSEYERSKTQSASANLGKNRESFCQIFLKKVLPSKLSIMSGEIWDSQKNKTGQLDIIILREDGPALHVGSEEIYLAEGVFSVIEVKSNLTRDKLIEAGEGLTKVANLKINFGVCITSGATINRPLRILFAYEGASWDLIIEEIKKNKWEELFDLICILNRGILLTKGRMLSWEGNAEFNIINGKAVSLAFMYYYLVSYSSSFLGRNLVISPYFEPINQWNDK